jgi:hypothetical protein
MAVSMTIAELHLDLLTTVTGGQNAKPAVYVTSQPEYSERQLAFWGSQHVVPGKGIPVSEIPEGIAPCRPRWLPEVRNGFVNCVAE